MRETECSGLGRQEHRQAAGNTHCKGKSCRDFRLHGGFQRNIDLQMLSYYYIFYLASLLAKLLEPECHSIDIHDLVCVLWVTGTESSKI